MKVGGSLLLMSLLGTMSQAAKLLKVPRIYNAIITSDEMLIPSQAYPALSPILQGVQYPFPGYVAYQPVIPNQVPMTGFLSNNGKSFTYAMRQDLPDNENKKPVINKATFPEKSPPPSNKPTLFTPNLAKNQDPSKEEVPNFIPNSNFRTNKSGTKPFYPHIDNENGQILNVINYDNKKIYSASSPVSLNPTHTDQDTKSNDELLYSFPMDKKTQNQNEKPNANSFSDSSPDFEYRANTNDEKLPETDETDYQNQEPFINQYPRENNYVKNNRPKDQSIVDVPPPPLPISNPNSEPKKPQEYPPAPVGLFL